MSNDEAQLHADLQHYQDELARQLESITELLAAPDTADSASVRAARLIATSARDTLYHLDETAQKLACG